MTDIVIAAAPADGARADAIAEALAALGFDVAPRALDDADMAKAVDDAKCVLALWSPAASEEPKLTEQATLALERNKLVCAELDDGALPAPFEAAPRTNLDASDRVIFKQRFEALIAQIEKLTPTEGDSDALPQALAKARAVLGMPPAPQPPAPTPEPISPLKTAEPLPPTPTQAPPPSPALERRKQGWQIAALGAMTLLLFAVGMGTSRLMTALRAMPLRAAHASDAVTVSPTALSSPRYGLTEVQLQTLPWREAAGRLNPAETEQIKAAAEQGDAFAQTLACLGHLAGAPNFLPSPTAAGAYCDQAAAQDYPAGLYMSWTLRHAAPNAPITEAVARDRLAQAAQRGLVAAQIDYAQVLAPDARAPAASQVEAGRLLQSAAEHGDPRGQYSYARWLRDSPAGPRNPTAAIPYLQHAADAGEVDALHMLATFYRDGIGVARDSGRARALYQRAAARNFAPSMMNLADMLRIDDSARAAQLYAQLACMRDERQIAPLATRRLHAMGQTARCG
ncbi:MAG: sel1 repeat family protein [Proteobacteria bacterium]|nr:sel1 repeat family protein [Pseudomonadota bacterium]